MWTLIKKEKKKIYIQKSNTLYLNEKKKLNKASRNVDFFVINDMGIFSLTPERKRLIMIF